MIVVLILKEKKQQFVYFMKGGGGEVNILNVNFTFLHSFHSLSYDRSTASCKTSSPHSASAIYRCLFQFPVSSRLHMVIQ